MARLDTTTEGTDMLRLALIQVLAHRLRQAPGRSARSLPASRGSTTTRHCSAPLTPFSDRPHRRPIPRWPSPLRGTGARTIATAPG
jgi:hypothetical protein